MNEELTDIESLVILSNSGAEGAQRELLPIATANPQLIWTAVFALEARGLVEMEGFEVFPSIEALELATEYETEKLR